MLLIWIRNRNEEVFILSANVSLEEIIAQIRSGKKEAFDELFRQTRDSVYFHAIGILKNEEDALDAVQETYFVAFQQIDRLQTPAAARQWLCAIAGNISLNKLRKDKHLSGISLDDEEQFIEPAADEQYMPEAVLDKNAGSEIIAEMIRKLPDLQRTAVILFYYDGLPVSKVAEIMGCPENTVKSRLSYARKNLEAQVRAEEKQGVRLYSISPAAIVLALRYASVHTVMSQAAAAKLGAGIAAACGYSAAAGTVSAAGSSAAVGGVSGAAAVGAVSGAAAGTKIMAIVLAAVIGAGTLTAGVVHYSRTKKAEPTAAVTAAAKAENALSPEQAHAYYTILEKITDDCGVCKSEKEGPGLAYADLIDFDGDGTDELYLFYIDQNHAGESDAYFQGVDGSVVWCLHEQVYKWNGSEATEILDELHSSDGGYSGRNNTGRILFAENGKTSLCSNWIVDHSDFLLCNLKMDYLQDESFQTGLQVNSSFLRAKTIFYNSPDGSVNADAANFLKAYGLPDELPEETPPNSLWEKELFSSGYIDRNGQRKEFSCDDCRIIYDKQGDKVLSTVDGETPETLLTAYKKKFKEGGREVISSSDDYDMTWQTNDVQALMDRLKSQSPALSAQPAQSSDSSLPENRRAAYIKFAQSLRSTQFDHLLLYDCNGDGLNELLAVYGTDDPNFDTTLIHAEIYSADENGNAVRLYAAEPQYDAGGAAVDFVSLQYKGKSCLAYSYSNWDDYFFITIKILSSNGSAVRSTHSIDYSEKDVLNGNEVVGTTYSYTADGKTISEKEFKSIQDSESILCAYTDMASENGLTPAAFIKKYRS